MGDCCSPSDVPAATSESDEAVSRELEYGGFLSLECKRNLGTQFLV